MISYSLDLFLIPPQQIPYLVVAIDCILLARTIFYNIRGSNLLPVNLAIEKWF